MIVVVPSAMPTSVSFSLSLPLFLSVLFSWRISNSLQLPFLHGIYDLWFFFPVVFLSGCFSFSGFFECRFMGWVDFVFMCDCRACESILVRIIMGFCSGFNGVWYFLSGFDWFYCWSISYQFLEDGPVFLCFWFGCWVFGNGFSVIE